MNKIISIFLFLFALNISAQVGGEDEVYLNGDKTEAKFQGGNLNTFHQFVLARLDKSKILKAGQLVCSFTINEEGDLKNIRIVKDLGGESAFELIRVLRLSPKWQPAMRNGKAIAIDIKLPFTFVVDKPILDREDMGHTAVIDNGGQDANDKVYVAVEKQAEFPGGANLFMKYFAKNFTSRIPLKDVKAILKFIVNKDGSLSDIKMVRLSVDNEQVRNEIISVVAKSPKWIPAQQNGKLVRMHYTLPLTLTLN